MFDYDRARAHTHTQYLRGYSNAINFKIHTKQIKDLENLLFFLNHNVVIFKGMYNILYSLHLHRFVYTDNNIVH